MEDCRISTKRKKENDVKHTAAALFPCRESDMAPSRRDNNLQKINFF